MNLITRTGIVATLLAISAATLAEVKASDAVEYRQGIYKAVKWNFGPMGDMVKGKQEVRPLKVLKLATSQITH